MRHFYIFNIKKEFYSLTKENPFNMYKSLEKIYYLNKKDIYLAFSLFETIVKGIEKERINNLAFKMFNNDKNYTKFNNIHCFNNYFTDEETKIIINKSHIYIKTNKNNNIFFKLLDDSNYFVCDFQNKDYFWINQVLVK